MKAIRTRLCSVVAAFAIFALMLCPASTSTAQDKAPVASAVGTDTPTLVLAVNSIDKLVPDIIYLTRAIGQQSYGGFVTLSANQYAQGLDRSRPIGLAVNVPETDQPKMYLMLPIKDLDTFFAANAQFITKDDLSEGRYSLTIGVSTVFASYQNDWLYVTQFEDDLANAPKNPQSLLEPLVARYDIGVNVNMGSLPAVLKEQFISSLDQGFESAIARRAESQSEEEAKAAREAGQATMDQIKDMVNNIDQVLLGINIDQSAKVFQIDAGAKFLPDSDLAKQVALQSGLTTKFANVTQATDPIQYRYRSKLSEKSAANLSRTFDMQVAQLDDQLKTLIDDAKAREIAKNAVLAVVSSLKETTTAGDIDGAYAVNFNNGLNLVGLGQVAAPEKLEADIVRILKEHQQEQYAPKLPSTAATYKGLNVYEGNWPLPADENFDGLRSTIGESVPFALAFGNKQAGFAFGRDAATNLKSAIDRSAAAPVAANPMDVTVELLPVLQYAETLASDDKARSILQSVISKVSEFSNKDMLKVESRAMNNGGVLRITLEEGLLQAIGTAATASPPRR